MNTGLHTHLNDAEIKEFGKEIDAIYEEARTSLGAEDQLYIRQLIRFQRSLALGSRIVMFASLSFLPNWFEHSMASWWLFILVMGLGVLGLGVAKIIENMEIGHNVMHGQWDWMHDPQINSTTWEWDNVCPSDQWKHSHNVVHHTWTNVLGKDRDIGYEYLRITEFQKWNPLHLFQPILNLSIMLLFQWGVGFHDVEPVAIIKGAKNEKKQQVVLLKDFGKKALLQCSKDYILWPLLAGPFFLYVAAGNLFANGIRNIWSNIIIFCGHFPNDVYLFTEADVEGETRDQWYIRQLLGSANITGGKIFHILSGNLSYQIEHHLFPDLASNRYSEVGPRVEAVCQRYGLPYNKGTLGKQYGTTVWKLLRLTFPGGKFQPEPLSRT